MFINTNVAAINAHRNLAYNNTNMSKTMEKLSSGFRINRAADDAAGLAISEKMRFQINGLNQAMRNAQDGISMIQTAEGALTEVHSMLQRMNVLANQAANGTYANEDKMAMQLEINELIGEIEKIAQATNFNGIDLLKDSQITFQIGTGTEEHNKLVIDLKNMDAASLGVLEDADGDPVTDMTLNDILIANSVDEDGDPVTGSTDDAISIISAALQQVSDLRANFGAIQNRLEHTINNLGVNAENLSAAESRIRNADMAAEMTDFTRNQILVQAGTAMLAQANAMPQSVLQLLG